MNYKGVNDVRACMRHTFPYLIFFILLVAFPTAASVAQDIADLEKRASDFFEKKEYAEAMPLYSQLLANYNENVDYNYRYGTCVLFAEENKFKAVSFLAFACKSDEVDPEAFFYLGKAYQLNYEFKRALTAYNTFKEKSSSKEQAALNVAREIETCNNGRNLLRNISDISVTEKKSLKLEDFAKAYQMDAFGGRIIRKTDEFRLKYDKKIGEESVMYFQKNSDFIYFSSYGDKGENGRDIYFVKRNGNGDWSDPERLSNTINTAYDEHYPFIHPNGNKLYFASKGHNSMGGYDIFETTRDPNTGLWSEPVNLDFAVNTPDDDFLLVTDTDEKTAYFASTRESALGEVTVYKIHLSRVPINETLLKGVFKSEKSQSASITVLDAETEKEIGIYKTDPKTGEYAISLPNGGNFVFVVEMEGSSIAHKSPPVKLPKLKRPRPLKQEMEIIRDDKDYEQLLLNNLFDEDVNLDLALTAELLRQKASLNVGDSPPPPGEGPSVTLVDEPASPRPTTEIVDPVTETPDPVTETPDPVATIDEASGENNSTEGGESDPNTAASIDGTAGGGSEVSSEQQMVLKAYANASFIEDQVAKLNTSAGIAQSLSQEKSEVAVEKNDAANTIIAGLSSIRNDEEKQKKSDEAYILKKQSQQFAQEAKLALELSEELKTLANKRSQQQITAEQYARELETEVGTSPKEQLEEKLKLSTDLAENAKGPTTIDDILAERQERSETKRTEALAELKKAKSLEEEARRLEEEIAYFNSESENRKNRDMAEELKAQAAESQLSLNQIKEEQAQAGTKADRLREEAELFAMRASVSEDLNEAVESTTPPEAINLSASEQQALRSKVVAVDNQVEEERPDLVVPGAEGIFITNAEVDEFDDVESVMAFGGADDPAPDPIESPAPEASPAVAEGTDTTEPGAESGTTTTEVAETTEEVVPTAVLIETIADDFEPRLFDQEAETDPMLKEAARAEIYSEWAEKLEGEAAGLRQVLTNSEEEDPELVQRIARLDGEARRKRALADKSYEEIAEMSDEQGIEPVVAVTDPGTDTGESEGGSEGAAPENGNSITADAPSEYTEAFENRVAEAENMDDPGEREGILAEVYMDWQASTDAEIGDLEGSLSSASESEKPIIEARLNRLRTESDIQATEGARHSEAALEFADATTPDPVLTDEGTEAGTDPAIASIDEGSETGTDPALAEGSGDGNSTTNGETTGLGGSAENIDPSSLPVSSFDENYEDRLGNLEGEPEEIVIVKRLEVNQEWLVAINSEIDLLEEEKTGVTDPDELEEFETRISGLEQKASLRQSMISQDESLAAEAGIDPAIASTDEGTETGTDPALANTDEGTETGTDPAVAVTDEGTETGVDPAVATTDEGSETGTEPTFAITVKGSDTATDPATTTSDEGSESGTDPALAENSNGGGSSPFGEPVGSDAVENIDVATLPISSYDQNYSERIENLDGEPEEIVIVKRLEVNQEWLVAINSEIDQLEEEKTTATDPDELKEYEARIAGLEQKASLRQSAISQDEPLAAEAAAMASTETDQPVNIEGNSVFDQAFTDELEEINRIPDDQRRSAAEADLYGRWAQAVDQEIERKRAETTLDADEAVKKQNDIAALEAQAKKHRQTATIRQTRANALASVEPTTSPAVTTNDPAVTQPTETTPVVDPINDPSTTNPDATPAPIALTKEEIQELETIIPERPSLANTYLADAKSLEIDAAELEDEAASVRNKSQATSDLTKQADLSREANLLSNDAQEKRLEAVAMRERARRIQVAEEKIVNAIPGEVSESEKEFALAERLSGEATAKQAQADTVRAQAENTKKRKDREALIAQANGLEQVAVEKLTGSENSFSLAADLEQAEKDALARAFVIRDAETVSLPEVSTPLADAEVPRVTGSQEYRTYYVKKQQSEKVYREAQVINQRAASLRDESAAERSQMQELMLANSADEEETAKQARLDQAKRLDVSSRQKNASADSLEKAVVTVERKSTYLENEANRYLLAQDESLYMDILAYEAGRTEGDPSLALASPGSTTPAATTGGGVRTPAPAVAVIDQPTPTPANPGGGSDIVPANAEPTTPVRERPRTEPIEPLSFNKPVNVATIDRVPEKVEAPIFSKTESDASIYSDAKPIPELRDLPEGLVFKVQIGAFRNPIPQDIFKGFAPIAAEPTDFGVTRYTAGWFESEGNASVARDAIRDIGYQDAFVVAYLNGVRISMFDARSRLGTSAPAPSPAPVASTNQPTGNTGGVVNSTPGVANAVEGITGLFYTVQVGVFSREVGANDLFNIDPLVSERTGSGAFRYSTGIFSSVPAATVRKDEVVGVGVADAFVTAYFNGKRITVAEARQLANENGSSIFTKVNDGRAPAATTPAPAAVAPAGTISFKVNFGTYDADVPIKEASILLSLQSRGVKLEKAGGRTTYLIGDFSTYAEAQALQQEIESKGKAGMTILGFENGQAIDLQEAIQKSGS